MRIARPRAQSPLRRTPRKLLFSVFDNMATARNIVMSYGSDYAAAYAYGPGHKDGGAADMRERHHYAGQVTARTPTYRNFFDCFLGKN